MAENNGQASGVEQPKEKEVCGIIMPISDTDSYPKGHWTEVKLILEEAIINAGFQPNLVSDATDSGIIHNRIVNNIYNNPIVVCDVSSKNPNVMFELGLRLAFDRPTIIVKDNRTDYTFDAGIIEHLGYPADLTYHLINTFKTKLKEKLLKTVEASLKPDYSTFLGHFVQYKRKLDEKNVTDNELIFKELQPIKLQLNRNSEFTRLNTDSQKDLFRNLADPITLAKNDVLRYLANNNITPTILLSPHERDHFSNIIVQQLSLTYGFTKRGSQNLVNEVFDDFFIKNSLLEVPVPAPIPQDLH